MKRTIQISAIVVLVLSTILLITAYSRLDRGTPKTEDTALMSVGLGLPQMIHPIDLDRPFSFAGEPLPMQLSDVRERLDRELIVNSYRHSNTILNIKKANKYFPVIEPILKKNGVPDDFKYLAVAESDLNNATSPAGAKGIWQFMPPIAKYYGLEINREVDERYHIEKATQAACEYLLDVKRRFGSWTLAAASYNVGGTRLARELENQRAETFYDLNLNEETSRYLFRLVALKEILSHPEEFGFFIEEKDRYQPLGDYELTTVEAPISNLGDFAREHGISYRTLKVYNPWLLTSSLRDAGRKPYEIKVPVQKVES